jgi:hypothetical protein
VAGLEQSLTSLSPSGCLPIRLPYDRNRRLCHQRLTDGSLDNMENEAGISKAYLSFGGMHVYVYSLGGHL